MSAGGLISLGVSNIAVSFVSFTLGYVIDFLNGQTIFYNLSQGTLNTMNYGTLAFAIFPFLFFIITCINYILVSANEAGGYV